jgi:hypothetical protein
MQRRVVRGSSFDESFANEPGSLLDADTYFDGEVGFRVVCDSAARAIRGGAWDDVSLGARAAYRHGYLPVNCFSVLGLRMVHDEEGR